MADPYTIEWYRTPNASPQDVLASAEYAVRGLERDASNIGYRIERLQQQLVEAVTERAEAQRNIATAQATIRMIPSLVCPHCNYNGQPCWLSDHEDRPAGATDDEWNPCGWCGDCSREKGAGVKEETA